MSALNKSELVAAIASHTGESQAAVNRTVDAFFEICLLYTSDAADE